MSYAFHLGTLPAGASPIANLASYGRRYDLTAAPTPAGATHFAASTHAPGQMSVEFFDAAGEPISQNVYLLREEEAPASTAKETVESSVFDPGRGKSIVERVTDTVQSITPAGVPSWVVPVSVAGGAVLLLGGAAVYFSRKRQQRVAANRRRAQRRRRR